MLVCIGLAAASGIFTIFTAQTNVTGRIALTCLFGGVALGACMACARMMAHEAGRPAGVLGMFLAVIGFVLCAVATWLWRTTVDEKLGLTGLAYVPIAIALTAMVRLTANAKHKHAGIVGAGWLCVLFIISMLAIWVPWGQTEWQMPQMAAALALMWPLAPLTFCNIGVEPARWWRLAGIILLPITTSIVLALIWKIITPDELLMCTAIVTVSYAALGNGSFLINLTERQRWVRIGTLACAGLCGAMLIIASAQRFSMDPWGRFAAASALATVCGLLAMIVMERLNARAISRPVAQGETASDVNLACPRCQSRHTLKMAGDRCPECGLLIIVRIARLECCSCSYPLDGIKSGQCPECGTAVEQTVKAALEEKSMQNQAG